MRDMHHSTSVIDESESVGTRTEDTEPDRPNGLTAWLLSEDAERWGRRASFYERHRDYFPRLASGRFVARCRELESASRKLAQALVQSPLQVRWG